MKQSHLIHFAGLHEYAQIIYLCEMIVPSAYTIAYGIGQDMNKEHFLLGEIYRSKGQVLEYAKELN